MCTAWSRRSIRLSVSLELSAFGIPLQLLSPLSSLLSRRYMRALLSVSDKTGIADFATRLAALGWELISTGGTAKAWRAAGPTGRDAGEVTDFPEMRDGRVKTRPPAVHGGLLARRDLPEHMDAIRSHGITPIDLVVVNLYPFRETAARKDVAPAEVVEQ